MNFIALDLETTGLSPETDTIIEIAAIRFTLEIDGDTFVMKNPEEHSQLIHPGRPLEQEVTMITGITSDMLEWKPTFESVRDRVRNFIGDAIIVGHNVLFDIAMFASHGIDLSSNKVIDTFELSEIFSQDIESLNLGFLANRYGLIDPDEDEHRALTDTKVSIRLFLKYLGEVQKLSWKKKQIWDILAPRDESNTLRTLSHICHTTWDAFEKIDNIFLDLVSNPLCEANSQPANINLTKTNTQKRILIETHGNIHEEIDIIHNVFRTHTHINLITPGYKTAIWMSSLLNQYHIENLVTITYQKWCSVDYMRELLLGNETYSRKKMILILKIAIWMTETKTWLLDELKFYGEERNMLELFRSRLDESSIWNDKYKQQINIVPVLITDIYDFDLESIQSSRYTIIKDIPLVEDIIRRTQSIEISFDKLDTAIWSLLSDGKSVELRIHMTDMVSIIRGIYESIPERPTGPLATPPGAYGETYFITQAMLWRKGHKWLIHATHTLDQLWAIWKSQNDSNSQTRECQMQWEYIESSLSILSQFHAISNTNNNIVININNEKTKITYIPRNIKTIISPLLSNATAYGINISLPQTKLFLESEYGYTENEFIQAPIESIPKKIITQIEYHPGTVQAGTVILTTSQKHARDLGQVLRKIHGKNIEILIQGLSGGKWKMLSIFKAKREKTILIGIIDTWRDEYELWKCAQYIIIAKLPFDPPTDTYFLARTVGMQNNFSEYSEPIVTIRLNTLIERILSSGYIWTIVTADSRLIDTEWGKRIQRELL
jgi:DNA polymerase III epsilon subunit family exonuclease